MSVLLVMLTSEKMIITADGINPVGPCVHNPRSYDGGVDIR